MRFLLFSLVPIVGLAFSCGGGDGGGSDNPTPSTSSWSNTAMQNLVASKCATSGCHNGSQAPNYTGISETSMKSDKKALSRVSSNQMPPSGGLSAADKTTFINFYSN